MSNLTEGTIILKTQLQKNYIEDKNNCKIDNLKNISYCLIYILILIGIETMIFAFLKFNLNNQIKIISDKNTNKILKLINDSNDKISYLEKEILKKNIEEDKLNDKNNTSINQAFNITKNNYKNYYQIELFNKKINDKYIKSQNHFCNNQNIFYNKKYEDKIKLIDIKFKDKEFNMFVYKNSDILSDYIINNKAWEIDETTKLLKALNYYSKKRNIKTEDIYIIDIGANIGWYSFIFGKYGYKIISFEPSKLNNYILKKTYCLNKEINLTIINKGLYNEEKKCYLYNTLNNKGNGLVKCEIKENLTNSFEKKGEIILTKLNNYLPFFMNKNLVLIKMDIEGAERKAIDGGIELITKYKIPFIFMEFTPSFLKRLSSDPKEFLQLFVDNGYKISFLDFFNDHVSVDDIMGKNINQINLYLVYSEILE